MSAALTMSAFYEVDIIQNQNRRLFVEQRAVGTPITGALRNRTLLERSISEPVADRNMNTTNSQSAVNQSQQQQQKNVNSSRYKTELCRPFEENGYCKYGDKCQFAHGSHELRNLSRHPKYKTELCRTFHTVGFCPYGPRCHFIHSEDEQKLSKIDQMKADVSSAPVTSVPTIMPPMMGRISPQEMAARPSRFALSLPLSGRESLGSTGTDSPTSSVTSDSPNMSPTFIGDSDFLGSSFSSLNSSLNQAFGALSGPYHPPISAPPMASQHHPQRFQFPQDLPPPPKTNYDPQDFSAPMMAPLNIHTDPILSLTAGIRSAMNISAKNQQLNNNNNFMHLQDQRHFMFPTSATANHLRVNSAPALPELDFYAPPSPPDSLSGDSCSSLGSSSSNSNSSNCDSSLCGSPMEMSRSIRLPIFTSLAMN